MVFLKASCVPIAFFRFDEVLPCLTAAFVVFLHGKFLGHIEADEVFNAMLGSTGKLLHKFMEQAVLPFNEFISFGMQAIFFS